MSNMKKGFPTFPGFEDANKISDFESSETEENDDDMIDLSLMDVIETDSGKSNAKNDTRCNSQLIMVHH